MKNFRHVPELILLILSVVMIAKSLIGLLKPLKLKELSLWWTKIAEKVGVLIGIIIILFALFILYVVLINQPVINIILILMCAFAIGGSFLYFHPPAMRYFVDVFIADRSKIVVRIISGISLLAGIIFVITALWSWITT